MIFFPVWAIVVLCIAFTALILLGVYRYFTQPTTEDQWPSPISSPFDSFHPSQNYENDRDNQTLIIGGTKIRKIQQRQNRKKKYFKTNK